MKSTPSPDLASLELGGRYFVVPTASSWSRPEGLGEGDLVRLLHLASTRDLCLVAKLDGQKFALPVQHLHPPSA